MNVWHRPYHSPLIAALLSSVALPVMAQEMEDIGSFIGEANSYASDVSGDGSTVVGMANLSIELDGISNRVQQVFRWTSDGLQIIGTLRQDNLGNSYANAVSTNGAAIVGSAETETTSTGYMNRQAYRWTAEDGMLALGTFRADGTGYSDARDVSGDGAVVVGNAENDDSRQLAFLWTNGEMTSLGTLRDDGLGTSSAAAVSKDGSTVVGQAEVTPVDQFYAPQQAFRWTESDGMIGLGTLRMDGTGYSYANAVSADGSVVAGYADSDLGASQAYRWTSADGMQGLGTLRTDDSGSSYASALSEDGSTVVGYSEIEPVDSNVSHSQRAFRWTESDGMVGLGTLQDDNSGYSGATAVNADGSVVVGYSEVTVGSDETAPTFYQAFRWTADGMVGLGTLKSDGSGTSYAYDVSDDGTIVVGQADSDLGYSRAFIYRARAAEPAPEEPTPVEPTPVDPAPVDPTPEEPTPVDPAPVDPTPVEPAPVDPAPVDPTPVDPAPVDPTPVDPAPVDPTPVDPAPVDPAPVDPTPPGTMLDLENTQISIVENTREQGRTVQYQNSALVELLGTELEISTLTQPGFAGNISTKGGASLHASRPVAIRLDGALRTGGGVDDMGIAGATAAVGLTSNLTFGGFLHQGFTSDGDVLSVGTYLRSREMDGTGLTWRGAVGYSRGDVSFDRDSRLSNTESAEGEATIDTLAVSAELGYGIASGQNLFTPFVRISHSTTTRDAYTEADTADFPVSYEGYDATTTALTVGVDGRRDISDRSTVRFGAGIEVDLDRSDEPLRGSSEVPGLEEIVIEAPSLENESRPYVSLGLSHSLSNGSTVALDVGAQASAYSSEPRSYIAVGYEFRF